MALTSLAMTETDLIKQAVDVMALTVMVTHVDIQYLGRMVSISMVLMLKVMGAMASTRRVVIAQV